MESEGLAAPRRDVRVSGFVLASCVLLASMGTSIATVALPALAVDFDVPVTSVQLVILAYLLSVTVTIVSAGRLGDLKGRRFVLLVGLGLFAISSLLCSIAPNLNILVLGRVLQGVGGAILMSLPVAILRDIVAEEKTGFAMGLIGSMSAVGTALGPSLGGVLVVSTGWRSMFVILAVGAFVAFAGVLSMLPRDQKSKQMEKVKIDYAGIWVLAITLLAYAALMSDGLGAEPLMRLGLAVFTLMGVMAFLRLERNKPSALIDLEMLKDKVIASSLMGSLIVSNIMMATLVIGPFYLIYALHLNEAVAGMVMAVGPIVAALSGVPAGKVVDRFGGQVALLWGLGQTLVGLLCLSLLPGLFGVSGYVVSLVLLTPGFQLFMASNNATVMLAAKETQRGMVAGVLGLSRNLGFMLGASLMGSLFAWVVGQGEVATAPVKDIAHGFSVTFQVAAGLIGVTLAILFFSRRDGR